ncbi:hypothetical protein ABCS02_34200 [Microbacterium sp. X-17]|uniref:hypothetical protein n=1 Tax=Microbacterium sp. X-17 TaxID=3144404 RepID=UPI0031F58876
MAIEQDAARRGPLVLERIGNFYVGGDTGVAQTPSQLGQLGGGHVVDDPMYVEYLIPVTGNDTAVVMVPGGGISASSWRTTPDGRMGWDEYFARRGFPVYLADQVGRARSGFRQGPINDVHDGTLPADQAPTFYRVSNEACWTVNRIGPELGVPFEGNEFPAEAFEQLTKHQIPAYAVRPAPNPTSLRVAELARDIGGAVVVGHSESGAFPFEAVFADPTSVRGTVMIEGLCREYTDEEVELLACVPILMLFGDNLDKAEVFPGVVWTELLLAARELALRIERVGGSVDVVHLPEHDIRGNSHMMMFDRNNTVVADVIIDWIERRVGAAR